jgi:hypothetical protein
MNTYTRLILGAAAIFTIGLAVDLRADDSYWGVNEYAAITRVNNGISVAVIFDEQHNCDVAHLGVFGNPAIQRIGLHIDNEDLGWVEAVVEGQLALATLTNTGLSGIKRGKQMLLQTDQGSLPLNLTGSSAALNAAYENCKRPPAYKVLFPSGQLVGF